MASGRQAPVAKPLAFLSDVHGNLAALEAVLAELDQHEVSGIFVAGDLLYGGDQPLDVWRALVKADARCVRGLSDTALCMVDPDTLAPTSDHERSMAARFAKTRNELGDLVIEQLRRLPERLRLPLIDGREIVMVHGSPGDPSQEITHDMDEGEILALIADDPADVVVCGGSHVPFIQELPEVKVINVGSVGAAPEGGVAHFSILSPGMATLEVQQLHTAYGR